MPYYLVINGETDFGLACDNVAFTGVTEASSMKEALELKPGMFTTYERDDNPFVKVIKKQKRKGK